MEQLTEAEIDLVYLLVEIEFNDIIDESLGYKTPYTERLESILNKLAL